MLILTSCSLNSKYIKDGSGNPVKQCTNRSMYIIDDNLPPKLHKEVEDAFNHWNEVLGSSVFVNSDTGDVDSAYAWPYVGVTIEDVDFHGFHHCVQTLFHSQPSCIVGAKITVTNRCSSDPKMFNTLVRHAIGNFIGLSNTLYPGTLMHYQHQPEAQHPIDANDEEISAARHMLNIK